MPKAERLITVLVSVYNAEAYVAEALASILGQTHRRLEVVIVDDGSTDGTPDVLASVRDPRLRVITLPENRGVVHGLNTGLAAARGDFLARMDADDVAEPHWLERELAFLEAHPEIGIVGCQLTTFGMTEGVVRYPTNDTDIRLQLMWRTPFAPNGVLMRTSVLRTHDLSWDPEYPIAEDYKFWRDILRHTRGANLDDFLVRYRSHPGQVSVWNTARQRERGSRVRAEVAHDYFGLEGAILDGYHEMDFRKKRDLVDALIEANEEHRLFDRQTFLDAVLQWWYIEALHSAETGWAGAMGYWRILDLGDRRNQFLNWARVWKHKALTTFA